MLFEIFGLNPPLWIFTILFLLYLVLAMKNFYQQGYFKTIAKFMLLNFSYFIVAVMGGVIILIISFAFL